MRPRESRTRGPSVAVVPGKTLVILSPAPRPPGPCLPPPAARAPGAEETFPVTAQPHQGGPGAPATVPARSPAPCGEGRVPDCGLGVGVRPPPAGWDDPASSEALQAEWGSLQPPPPSPPLQRPPSPPLGERGVYSGSPAPLNTRALTAGQAPWGSDRPAQASRGRHRRPLATAAAPLPGPRPCAHSLPGPQTPVPRGLGGRRAERGCLTQCVVLGGEGPALTVHQSWAGPGHRGHLSCR